MRELAVSLVGQAKQGYPLLFGSGLQDRVRQWLREHADFSRIALISDERVADLYARRWLPVLESTGVPVTLATFAPGEASKTRDTKAGLEDLLLEAGFSRDSLVVGLGGGVALDMAGFVAATFMRGIPLISLPTTTLAMVDSAIGGKTGVDTPAGKNLIGAFHPPGAVFADVEHLASLEDAEYLGGFAEAVKHGLIASVDHCRQLETMAPALVRRDTEAQIEVLADSAAIKVCFVEQDERENGARKALNFGHTFGHALERLSGWTLTHGQAVARGIAAECRLSVHMGCLSASEEARVHELLSLFALPCSPFGRLPSRWMPPPAGTLQAKDYLDATRHDKKVRDEKVEYVLLSAVGRVDRGADGQGPWTKAVADDTVMAALFKTTGGFE